MTKYAYKDKAFTKVKAQIVGETLEEIFEQNDGVVLPSTVVRSARPKRSPIHNCFEWDNKKAADKYRDRQAGDLLRWIVIVHEQEDGDTEPLKVRAFVSVESEGGRYYTTINRAMKDEDIANNIEIEAYNDYIALFHKYKDLKLFRKVNNEIDKIKI